MQLPTTRAVTNGVNIGKPATFFGWLEVPPCLMAGLPEAADGLVRLGPHVRCVSGVAESVAIARAERYRAQRQNGR
jgi:hypothetical protein